MDLPNPCRLHVGLMCPRCGFAHERVTSLPDGPLTDPALHSVRSEPRIQFADAVAPVPRAEAVGFNDVDPAATWLANELVVTDDGRTRTIAYVDGEWVVTGRILHEPRDDPEVIHNCVHELAAVASPGDSFEDLPFDL